MQEDFAFGCGFHGNEVVLTGGWEEVAGEAGDGRCVMAAEEGVGSPGEVDFIDEVLAEEFFDEGAAAFAEEGVDFGVLAEVSEEGVQAAAVEGGGEIKGLIGDDVTGAAFSGEEGVGGVEVAALRDHATPGLGVMGGEGHVIGLEGFSTDEDGIGEVSNFVEAGEVTLGGEVGGREGAGGDFTVGGDGEVDDDLEGAGAEGFEDAEGLPAGADVMDAEEVSALEEAVGEEGDGAGVAVARVGQVQDVPDEGLTRDGEEDGAAEGEEGREITQDLEVIVLLFGKIEAGIEDELVFGEAAFGGEGDAILEEGEHVSGDIFPSLIGMGDLRLADRVHDEEGDLMLGAEVGVPGIRQGGDVIEDIDVLVDDMGDDFRSPGIDGEEWGENLGVIGGAEGKVFPADEEGAEAGDFFFDADGLAIGAGGFSADVDDVGPFADGGLGLLESGLGIEGAIAGEGVVIDIDDAHEEGAAREGDGAIRETKDHGAVSDWPFWPVVMAVRKGAAVTAHDSAEG